MKKSAHAEKIVRKKAELQATFFVRLVRSYANLWLLTNQIEETDKQTKLRWRVVDHSHIEMLLIWKTIYNCLRRLYIFTNSNNNRKNYCSTATTTNNATVATILGKWKSVLWQPKFRWDQWHRKFAYQWKEATFGNY